MKKSSASSENEKNHWHSHRVLTGPRHKNHVLLSGRKETMLMLALMSD
jgi:hypothetical protein